MLGYFHDESLVHIDSYAKIVDITDPAKQNRNFGLLGAACRAVTFPHLPPSPIDRPSAPNLNHAGISATRLNSAMSNSQNMTMLMSSQIVEVGHALYATNVYWIAICSLWFYDYLLTFPDEVKYAWKGRQTPVFWLYVMNRYLPLCFIIVNLVANTSDDWTPEICAHYAGMKSVAVMLTTCVAEIIITLRVYAVCHQLKIVLVVGGTIMAAQWALVIYVVSQTWRLGVQFQNPFISLLDAISTIPELTKNQTFHFCMNTKLVAFPEYLVADAAASLVFEALAFITIMGVGVHLRRADGLYPVMRTIQRDGAMYFFALFSGNLTWLVLVLCAPGLLKLIQLEPTIIISSVMINKITINLKRSGQKNAEWSMQTFGQPQVDIRFEQNSSEDSFIESAVSLASGGGTEHRDMMQVM